MPPAAGSGDGRDLFRDTPVRFLGYANEVGEALRHSIGGRAVAATYGLALAYALCDTGSKARAALQPQAERPSGNPSLNPAEDPSSNPVGGAANQALNRQASRESNRESNREFGWRDANH